VDIQSGGGNPQGLQVECEQGNRPQLAGGPQQIEGCRVWPRDNLTSSSGKPVGDPFLRRNNYDDSLIRRGNVPIANIAGGAPVRASILEDGAANLNHGKRKIGRYAVWH
jgi:hypothetical protein